MKLSINELKNNIKSVLDLEKEKLTKEEKQQLENALAALEDSDKWFNKENVELIKELLEVLALIAKFFLG